MFLALCYLHANPAVRSMLLRLAGSCIENTCTRTCEVTLEVALVADLKLHMQL